MKALFEQAVTMTEQEKAKQEKETQLFSMLNLIAGKHGMKIEIKDNVINLIPIDVENWSREKDIACAIELEEAFGNNERIS